MNGIEHSSGYLTGPQESPHEHQQSQLLSRIITNVVCNVDPNDVSDLSPDTLFQEKLNEAVMVLNKSLQVGDVHVDTTGSDS